jgi:uroporphyrinogen decarboxylase
MREMSRRDLRRIRGQPDLLAPVDPWLYRGEIRGRFHRNCARLFQRGALLGGMVGVVGAAGDEGRVYIETSPQVVQIRSDGLPIVKKMTSRERVEVALEHREPDRVPADLTISPDIYALLCGYLGEKFEPYWWDDWNHAFPSPEVLKRLRVDVYHLPIKVYPRQFSIDLETFRDEWGMNKKKVVIEDGSFMYQFLGPPPLADAETVDDILSYQWPSPEELVDVRGMEEMAEDLFNNTDFALTAVFGGNIFERSHYLRGMDNFLIDLLINPEIARAIMGKVCDIQMGVDRIVYSAIGKYLSYTRFNGEDVGTQSGPLISTETYRELVRPFLEKEWRAAKQLFLTQNPMGKIGIHSCGSVRDFVPQFIEMGADILNPVQPNAQGMDTAALKSEFGEEICFHGAVETQTVLTSGSLEDIRAEVQRRIRDLAPGGGYIISPSHNIQFGMSPENIVAMYDAIEEYGYYPIK